VLCHTSNSPPTDDPFSSRPTVVGADFPQECPPDRPESLPWQRRRAKPNGSISRECLDDQRLWYRSHPGQAYSVSDVTDEILPERRRSTCASAPFGVWGPYPDRLAASRPIAVVNASIACWRKKASRPPRVTGEHGVRPYGSRTCVGVPPRCEPRVDPARRALQNSWPSVGVNPVLTLAACPSPFGGVYPERSRRTQGKLRRRGSADPPGRYPGTRLDLPRQPFWILL